MSKKLIISIVSVIVVAVMGGLGWFFIKDFNPRKTVTLDGDDAKVKVEVEELGFYEKDDFISGTVYRPVTGEKKFPVVVYCHPIAADRKAGEDLCRTFAAKGWVVYAFDFRGGNKTSQSTGIETTGMTVATEADDIAAVLKGLRKVSYVQSGTVFLVGEGFGGYAALYAATKGASVKGLALLGAEYNRPDESKELYPKVKDIPTIIDKGSIVLGKGFYKESRDFDLLKKGGRVRIPVLILHGSSDEVTPYSYAAKAAQALPEAQIVPLDGAPHKISGAHRKKAATEICHFIAEQL